MLYLLDANVLMDANRDYYGINAVPQFWEWLIFHGEQGDVAIPIEIFEEVTRGDDNLAQWAKRPEVKKALLLKEDVDIDLVQRVLRDGYADDLTDTEVTQLGRDPFFISYALIETSINNRCIVTTEHSKPKKQRANRHIPDVCGTFDIPCCNSYDFFRILDFRTNWKS